MVRRELDNLFVVSNVGQARNVVRICANRRDESTLALVLGTRSTSTLVQRLDRYLSSSGIEVRRLVLPEVPTSPRPFNLRRITCSYEELVREYEIARLWIANVNVHYGVLASMFRAKGAAICYFEEGLGTYRRIEDPAFQQFGDLRWLSILTEILDAARRSFSSLRVSSARHLLRSTVGFGRSVSVSLARGFGALSWYRSLLRRAVSEHVDWFFKPWTEFEMALVAFPDLLDRSLIRSMYVCELEMRPLRYEVESAVRAIDQVGLEVGSTLFVSQPYGDRGPHYYRSVALALREAGVHEAVVRHHPRERAYNSDYMLNALRDVGIEVVWLADLPEVTAEALLATGRFSRCFAITSSVLIYGARLFPKIEFHALAEGTLSRLEASGRPIRELEGLRIDLDLFGIVDRHTSHQGS